MRAAPVCCVLGSDTPCQWWFEQKLQVVQRHASRKNLHNAAADRQLKTIN